MVEHNPPERSPPDSHVHIPDPIVVAINRGNGQTPPKYEPVRIYWDEQEDRPSGDMLVKDILPARGLSLLISQSGFFKSYSVLDLQMACISRQSSWVSRSSAKVA